MENNENLEAFSKFGEQATIVEWSECVNSGSSSNDFVVKFLPDGSLRIYQSVNNYVLFIGLGLFAALISVTTLLKSQDLNIVALVVALISFSVATKFGLTDIFTFNISKFAIVIVNKTVFQGVRSSQLIDLSDLEFIQVLKKTYTGIDAYIDNYEVNIVLKKDRVNVAYGPDYEFIANLSKNIQKVLGVPVFDVMADNVRGFKNK